MAGAIGNGPLAALGEEVEKTEIVSKRKRTLVKNLNAQEKEEGRGKEPKVGQKEEQEVDNLVESQEEQSETPGEEQPVSTLGEELEVENLEEQLVKVKQKLVKKEQEVFGRKSPGVKSEAATRAKDSSRQVGIIVWTVPGDYIVFLAGVSRALPVPRRAQP